MYFVATTSLLEVQLGWLPESTLVQRDNRWLGLKNWKNYRSPLHPYTLGHDSQVYWRKQRIKKQSKVLTIVLLGYSVAGAALMNEKTSAPFTHVV